VNKPEDDLLAKCYRNALQLAEEYRIDSIAFPAISAGAFGYPVKKAAEVAFRTIIEVIPKLKHLKRIRFVLHSERDFDIHKETLSRVLKSRASFK
jgi:O-acetyl-ADP-ribose deacetylase (regulator of RNase III)